MSNKKITDLQLISTLDDDLNLVGDDTIQTYRFTLAQLKSFINQEIQIPTVTKAEVSLSANQTVSSTSATKVNFNTIIEDTHEAFNTSSNRYNVLKTGRTRVEVSLGISNFLTGERLRISVYKNGTIEKTARRTTNASIFEQTFHTTVGAVKDDYLEIFVESSSDTNYTISNLNSISYAYFESVPEFVEN